MQALGVCFRHARALAAGLPRQNHVYITTEQLIRFHKNELDEMLFRLDSTQYARAFQRNPTLDHELVASPVRAGSAAQCKLAV